MTTTEPPGDQRAERTREILDQVRRDSGEHRVRTRARGEAEARELLDRSAGRLSDEEFRQFGELVSMDSKFGKERRDRFRPAFAGAQIEGLLAHLDTLNDWIERLWKGSEDDALAALDKIIRDPNALPLSGRSFPSLLMYIRDPGRFAIWMDSTDRGLATLTDYPRQGRSSGASGYLRFCEHAHAFADRHHLQPQEIDLVLSLAARRAKGAKKKGAGPTETTLDLRSPLFSERSFELLAELTADPTVDCYKANKDEVQKSVEEPVQGLMREVARQLPEEIRDVMETRHRIFARIPKNDFGRGGAWDYYWGAFYPKGGKRIEDAQLFVWVNRERLQCGFYIGQHGGHNRSRFLESLEENGPTVLPRLKELVGDLPIAYGIDEEADPDTTPTIHDVEPWISAAEREGIRSMRVFDRDTLLKMPAKDLVREVRTTFEALFPFVLLATADDPVTAIEEYTGVEAAETNPEYPLPTLVEHLGVDQETVERWLRALERKNQAVLYGPPGTGKTYTAKGLADHLVGGTDGLVELVQFHPAYAYEDFIQGIRPETRDDGTLKYRLAPGRFLEFCTKARTRSGPCVLIIDEINRANLSRVFGELMYLLEYREQHVPLAGGGDFRIPANVRLIGTMNTADRSIALVDHALRRRFAFIYLEPNMETLRAFHEEADFPVEGLISVLDQINREIGDPHYELGISFFLEEDLESEIEDIWRMEIEPYLEEYFFDRRGTVDKFRWDEVGAQILG